MLNTIMSGDKRKIFVCLLIFLVLLVGVIIVWPWHRVSDETEHSTTINNRQVVNHLPTVETEAKTQVSKFQIKNEKVQDEKADNDKVTQFDLPPLPSLLEEVHFTSKKPGSLTYQVEHYIEDEKKLVKQISDESFIETLLNMSDWNSNYYKLVIQDVEPNPAHPSCLKLIIYSRRFAKLVEHGREGLTEEETSSVADQLKLDLDRWRSLWADGQRIRSNVNLLHSVEKKSDELIVPMTLRINATMLFIGAFSIEEALPLVIESVETFGDDTNWAVVGYACDKILKSLDRENLSAEQQKIMDEYHAWQTKQETKIFEYETVELPSYKSSRRPFERATSLGASLDFSEGKVNIEIPPQHTYVTLTEGRGYYDPTGSSEFLRKSVSFAEAYSKTRF